MKQSPVVAERGHSDSGRVDAQKSPQVQRRLGNRARGTIDASEPMQLQQRIGNRATASLTGLEPPLQRRRSSDSVCPTADWATWSKLLIDWAKLGLAEEHGDGFGGVAQTESAATACKAVAERHYLECLAAGQRRLGRLTAVRELYAADAEAFARSKVEKRSAADRVFREYETEIGERRSGGQVRIRSDFDVASDGELSVEDVDQRNYRSAGHENYITLSANESKLVADDNARGLKRDPEGGIDNLANSEVFWQQIGAVATEGGSDASTAQKQLSEISRSSVSNSLTNLMIYMCLETELSDEATLAAQEFGPDAPEYLVLLGTPNGSAIVGILLDHIDQMDANEIVTVKAAMQETGGVLTASYG